MSNGPNIEALLVDEQLADMVWELWDQGVLTEEAAVEVRFTIPKQKNSFHDEPDGTGTLESKFRKIPPIATHSATQLKRGHARLGITPL